ncbi:MAG: hypothetical protein R3F61_30035 [Myxococcota bacterium]
MRVGTMFFGTVDEIEGQSIQTKFFIFGMPLFPVASYYVMSETVNGVQGFEIPVHTKSMALGFIRVWMMAPFGLAAFWWLTDEGSWIWMALVAIAWVVLTFFVGGLSAEERRIRKPLGDITGIYADPELLPHDTRSGILDSLRERWIALTVEHGLEDWETVRAVPELAVRVAPLVVALHHYSKACEGSDEWATASQEALALLD